MMALAPKKKADLIIALGMGKPHKADEGSDNNDAPSADDAHAALASAMADFLKAIDAKDADAMADAFKAADDVCEHYEDKSDEEPEPEEG